MSQGKKKTTKLEKDQPVSFKKLDYKKISQCSTIDDKNIWRTWIKKHDQMGTLCSNVHSSN